MIVVRRWGEVRIACVNGRAAGQQFIGKCRPPVILQWAKQGIGIDLVPRAVQKTAAIVTTDIVSLRRDRASIVRDVRARRIENAVPNL
ncbi:MAG: hypothetical protein DMF26_20005 [Verrucomicrobia bacterium]|nr:MAG: hypothetical protein DMF26_20005 [Verrucomicrobiota bacterium]